MTSYTDSVTFYNSGSPNLTRQGFDDIFVVERKQGSI